MFRKVDVDSSLEWGKQGPVFLIYDQQKIVHGYLSQQTAKDHVELNPIKWNVWWDQKKSRISR